MGPLDPLPMIMDVGNGTMENNSFLTLLPMVDSSILNIGYAHIPSCQNDPVSFPRHLNPIGRMFGIKPGHRRNLPLCGLYGTMLWRSTHGGQKLTQTLTFLVTATPQALMKPPSTIFISIPKPTKCGNLHCPYSISF